MSDTFTQASFMYSAISPMLVIFAAGIIAVLIEAFAPRQVRYVAQLALTLVALVVSFLTLVLWARHHQGLTAGNAVAIDGVTLMLQGTVLTLALMAVLAMAERFGGSQADAFTQSGVSTPGSGLEADAVRLGATTTEIFPLTLFAVAGMMLFPASNNLIAMFIALEILSLPLYILTGLARRRRLLSREASLKYFLLGAFSSAFFLFGSALVFGATKTLNLSGIASAVPAVAGLDNLLVPGLMLIAVGLLFKVAAVPFHSWTPDAYQGAPTPVTGFMAACTKVAAFGAVLRVFYVGFDGLKWNWQPILAIVAVLTMVVGAVLTVTQTDMKRLLAYSSITHAGFLLVGVVALDKAAVAGTLFYLIAYGFTTIAAFAIIAMVRSGGSEASHLSQWAGLGKQHPVVAGVYSFLMLAFTGIPLTSGFTSKFAVFSAAVGNGGAWLAVIGVLASAVTAFVYVRVIVLMYFSEPTGDTTVVMPSALTGVAVAAGTLITLLLGIVPAPILDLANHSALFIR